MVAPTPAATRAYSIAVVPLSSMANRLQVSMSTPDLLTGCILDIELQQRHEVRYQRFVGGWHSVFSQAVRPNPSEALPLERPGGTLPAPTNVERHQQVKVRIGVAREREGRQARLVNNYSQLLL